MWTFVFLFLVVRAQSSPITYISSILSEFKQFFRTYEVDGAISVERIRSKLTERIMGQQNAIAVVSHLLEKHYRNSSNGPLLMLFGGPSGCGKTLMAETIAEALTTTDGKSIRMFLRNMAELSLIDDKQDSEIEMHMLQTDIFNHLKKRPNSILVFDEIQLMKQIHIERLLTIFRKGSWLFVDKKVDTRNAVVIFTTDLNTATLAPDSSVADVMEIISSTFNTSTFSLLMKMVNVVPFVPLQGDDLMQIVSHSIAVVEEAAASRFPNWKGRIDADFELFQFLVDRCLRQASCSRTAGRGVAQVVKGDVEPKVFDELRHQEKLFQGKFYGDVAIRPEVAMERIAIEFISHASASHEAKSEL